METKLCRICGKLDQNQVNIFRTEGLKNKIETCLPIVVCCHSLLPDTLCGECLENVDNFYSFIKKCVQNVIVLEAQYDITESCLKTKRKHDKGCFTDFPTKQQSKSMQTDDYLDVLLREHEEYKFPPLLKQQKLVDYDIESDTNSESEMEIKPVLQWEKFGKKYFDDAENYLIDEIAQRKNRKRPSNEIIQSSRPKICKIDTSNRRKSRQPKKFEPTPVILEAPPVPVEDGIEEMVDKELMLPQVCLLCDEQFSGPAMLATHVFETHGIDMAQIVALSVENTLDKKKKLPNLLKISDLRKNDSPDESQTGGVDHMSEEPPTLLPSFVCSLCPAVFTARSDLFTHFRVKHPDQAGLLCGMCLYQANSLPSLHSHIEVCSQQHNNQTISKYLCQVCRYGDDNTKSLENHVLVHTFLLDACKKQLKMFDPADYICQNDNYVRGMSPKTLMSCSECGLDDFESFKEFSTHRRSQHSIFHCDLCNKFYGRNSHLWKHVNRLHKGHPSITCQLCYKTSASKYHLAQHFNKIHSSKPCKQKQPIDSLILENSSDDFMSQKFQAFDFQSVKQSFMRQELLEQKKQQTEDVDDNSTNHLSDDDGKKDDDVMAPKEIDASSDLYTNIITNYTPPANEGEFKCPKCGKGFHKKTLLKKHKKNCRPRLQKDLLTRCKSCSRIFKDRQSLAKHLVNYHSEYACEICGQKVQSKCEIVSHIRFSHPNCHLYCTMCGNILRSQQDMVEHVRDHLNSYVCQFCADALPSKIKLKMHILSLHRKILSLSCGVCLKLFESQQVLRDHVRLVHRDQLAPLTSCPVCGKNYGSKWKTYDHLNKSHGRMFKACKVCLEVFDNEIQLQSHYETVHANSISIKNNAPITTIATKSIMENHFDGDESDHPGNNSEEQSDDVEDDEENNAGTVKTTSDYTGLIDLNNSKISLLEKRLLGKEEFNAKTKITPVRSVPVKSNNNKKDKTILAETSKKEDQWELETTNNSPNPQHNSSKRTVYVNSNDPSFCEICHKTWPAKKHLWQHYIRCHKSVAATVCGICLKTNKSYACLQKHLRQTHPTLLHGQGFGSNFICRICGRYHNASSKLKLHMAIHENFDWSLLEQQEEVVVPEEENKETPRDEVKIKDENGYDESVDINYESLIEQVECSSGSDTEDEDTAVKVESSSDDEDDDEDDEDDEDSGSEMSEENSLERQMLQNMLHEKNDIKAEEYVSSVTDDGSSNSCSVKSEEEEEGEEVATSSTTDGDQSNSSNVLLDEGNIFRCKPEEIDSAVQSIKYECVEKIQDDIDMDYCDLQQTTPSLNDHEIESAVGSIL